MLSSSSGGIPILQSSGALHSVTFAPSLLKTDLVPVALIYFDGGREMYTAKHNKVEAEVKRLWSIVWYVLCCFD